MIDASNAAPQADTGGAPFAPASADAPPIWEHLDPPATGAAPSAKAEATPPQQANAPVPPPPADQPGEAAPVPEAYGDFNLPEGFEVIPGLMEEFKGTAKQLRLNQAQAQRLIDLQIKAGQAQAESWVRQRQNWRAHIEADATYGGPHFAHTVRQAKTALDVYDPSGELRQMLTSSGFEDNPAVLRFLAKVGKQHLREADVLTSRTGGRSARSLMDELWPDSV